MKFFSSRITEDEFLAGLGVASIAISAVIPIMIAITITIERPYRWQFVWMSLGVLSITTVYVAWKLARARRSGTVALSPTVAFVLTCLTVVTIVLGHLAAYEWTENVFLAVLVLPMLFFAVIGDNRMLFAGWVVVTIGLAIDLGVEHLRPDVFWAALELYAALNLIAALMISAAVRKLHFRFRSRDALRELTKTFAGADSVETALADCLPLVRTVVPCTRAAVYDRAGGTIGLTPIVQWCAPGRRPITIDQGDIARFDLAAGATVVGRRCLVPAGYLNARELVLVLDGIDIRQASPLFIAEAANGLCSSLLLMTARISHLSGLRHESRTDPLTGLANRRALEERIDFLTAHAARSGATLTVAMIDLDHFKHFNDRFGHQSGDRLLRALADNLSRRLRAQDLFARYGGEEFCVVLPDTELTDALTLLEAMRETTPTILHDRFAPTISAGVAEWAPGDTTGTLLERADKALYAAKAAGRNRVIGAAAHPAATV